MRQILPIEPQDIADITVEDVDYIYEPSAEGVFAELLPRYIEMTIYAACSRPRRASFRRAWSPCATRPTRREEMIETLTLVYNKARQEQITKELLDIVGGVEAMKA